MSYTYSLKNNRDIQLELVDGEGRAIIQRPVSIEELMNAEDGLDVGHGVSIQLDEMVPAPYHIEDEEEEEEDDESSERQDDSYSLEAPPGTEAATNWYEVLHTLRQDVHAKSHGVKGAPHADAVTPLQTFQLENSGTKKNAPASRREVWASFSPPADPKRNYQHLEYVSVMRHITTRRFRPSPLSLHAAATYLHPKDKGQRILLYGGIGAGARTIEQEMYEFSLISCTWKRLEGKNFVPAGHYGHSLTTVPALHRVVVVGGIGPGGLKCDFEEMYLDPLRAARADALLHFATLNQENVLRAPSLVRCKSAIGFVPYVFDMDLERLEWRAIQTPQPLTLAFHTAVAYGKVIYLYGGLTEQGVVSGQLLAIDVETFAMRVVKPPSPAAAPAPPVATTSLVPLPIPAPVLPLPTAAASAPPMEPPPRFLHTAVRYGPYMIVFGGFSAQNEPLSDTWAFDMIHERWERLDAPGAVARAGHSATVVGSRMIVIGGFSSSVEECLESTPVHEIGELSLIPTPAEQYRWRVVRSRPKLPGLAFSTLCACGDHLSLFLMGGLLSQQRKPSGPEESSVAPSSATASRSVSAGRSTMLELTAATGGLLESRDKAWTSQFITLDDAIVLSFPARRAKTAPSVGSDGEDLSVPEYFKPFVQRQEDFLKRKSFNVEESMRKVSTMEKESMEPTLYLKTEEIELLVEKGEEMCESFSAYNMNQLPSNCPDRDLRVKLVENCISLGRQTRDILKSMKGSAIGVTAVKSKKHRQKAGQKFEDYSAAKPFRRYIISTHMKEIQGYLKQMKRLNKSLREVVWEEKNAFIAAVEEMQHHLDRLSRTINSIMNKYVQSSVEKLMKGVERHKDVMKKLTEVVEKNEQDKIWNVQQARDMKRGNSPPVARSKMRKITVGSAPPPIPRSKSSRNRIFGEGYFKDESKVFAHLSDTEWKHVVQGLERSERCAEQLATYCREGMSTASDRGPTNSAVSVTNNAVLPPPLSTVAALGLDGLYLSPPPLTPPPVNEAVAGSASTKDIVVAKSNALRQETENIAKELLQELHTFSKHLRGSPLSSATSSLIEVPADPSAAGAVPHPVEQTAIAPSPSSCPPPSRDIPLAVLRPLLQTKERLRRVARGARLIRQNTWDGNDLSGAPPDAKVMKLCQRLQKNVEGIAQIITTTMLSASAAHQPEVVPARKPPVPKQTRAASAHRKSRKATPSEAPGRLQQRTPPSSPSSESSYSSDFDSREDSVTPAPPLPRLNVVAGPIPPLKPSSDTSPEPPTNMVPLVPYQPMHTIAPTAAPGAEAVRVSSANEGEVTVSSAHSGPTYVTPLFPSSGAAVTTGLSPNRPMPLGLGGLGHPVRAAFTPAYPMAVPSHPKVQVTPAGGVVMQPPPSFTFSQISAPAEGDAGAEAPPPTVSYGVPMVSFSPGTFILQGPQCPAATTPASEPPAPLPAPVVDEDYFYFGDASNGAVQPAAAPAPHAYRGSHSTAPATLPSQHVSRPLGSAVHAYHVPATAPAARRSSSGRAAETPKVFKSKMTPGERRIREARERLSRK